MCVVIYNSENFQKPITRKQKCIIKEIAFVKFV